MNYQKCVLTKQASDCLHSGDFVHNAMMAYPLQIKKRKKMFSDFVQDDNSVQYLKKKKIQVGTTAPKSIKIIFVVIQIQSCIVTNWDTLLAYS